MGETVAASDNSLPADRTDTRMAKAAIGAETESSQERQARYLRLLDQFGDGVPPGELLTIRLELAKSLMGED